MGQWGGLGWQDRQDVWHQHIQVPPHVPALLPRCWGGWGRGAREVGRSRVSLRPTSLATWQVTKQPRVGNDFFCQFSNLSNEQENKSSWQSPRWFWASAPHSPLVLPAHFITGLWPEDTAITPPIIFSLLTSLSRWSHLEVLTFKWVACPERDRAGAAGKVFEIVSLENA